MRVPEAASCGTKYRRPNSALPHSFQVTTILFRPWRRLTLPPTCNGADPCKPSGFSLKSKRGTQSQADGFWQDSRRFSQTLTIETYQSTKQANYENTQNPKHTKPNRFKNEPFQQPDSNREPKPRLQSVPNGFSDVQIFDPAQLFTSNLIRR